MRRRQSVSSAERLRRSKSSASDESTDDTSKKATGPRKRIVLACANCRRRKIRCDGLTPACSNCARQGRHLCDYVAVSAEENRAAKERKQLARQRREQHGPKDKKKETGDKKESSTVGDNRKVERFVDKVASLSPAETQLSTRRRWNRTMHFDGQGAIPIRGVSSPSRSPDGPRPQDSSSSAPGTSSFRLPRPTPTGLTAATVAMRISDPNDTHTPTAPIETVRRTSYFEPADSRRSSYSTQSYSGLAGALHSPPSRTPNELSPPSFHRAFPQSAPPSVGGMPTLSPQSYAVPLPSSSQYPLTPPSEQVQLSRSPSGSFDEHQQQPWYDAAPPPTPPVRRPQRLLHHSYSVPQLPQYSPNENWQLYHAIPSPVGVAPSAISPGPRPTTALHPEYFPPTPVDPPPHSLVNFPVRQPTSLDFLPETLTPVSTGEPASSLGLQYMNPVEQMPLTLAPELQTTSWASSPDADDGGEYGEAVRYASNPWTDARSDGQSHQMEQQGPFDSLPVW